MDSVSRQFWRYNSQQAFIVNRLIDASSLLISNRIFLQNIAPVPLYACNKGLKNYGVIHYSSSWIREIRLSNNGLI